MKGMKIYTKTGDDGETSLIGGERVQKSHPRIEAYGTVDELNSFIGILRAQEIDTHSNDVLVCIQNNLFTICSLLAADSENIEKKLPQIHQEDVSNLEKEIDAMNDKLPEIHSFILPGGNQIVSYSHIARTICRRAERTIIKLSEEMPVNSIIIKYLNRLSDFLFVLARKFANDFNVNEVFYKSNR